MLSSKPPTKHKHPKSTTKSISTPSPKPLHKRINRNINQITSQPTINSTSRSFSTKPSPVDSSAQSSMESLRLYTKDSPVLPNFDYVVVGGGSGGISSARRAASYGAKVLVIEKSRLGGTCVNVGCIPKKLMWYAANVGHSIHDAKTFGFDELVAADKSNLKYNWAAMKERRDAYIHRLNGMYWRNSMRDGIYIVRGSAEFAINPETDEPDMTKLIIKATEKGGVDESEPYLQGFKVEEFTGKEVFVDEGFPITINVNTAASPGSYKGSDLKQGDNTPLNATANFLMAAPGGYPTHLKFEGHENVIDSNGFFNLTKQPRKVCVTGAGYIGVELAQVMALTGSKVTFVIRGERVLQSFDQTITETLMPELEKQCTMVKQSSLSKVVKLTAEDIANKGISAERKMDEDEVNALFTEGKPVGDLFAVYAGLCKDGAGCPSFLGYFDVVLSAVGRTPATHIMNVPTSVTTRHGHVLVDEMGHLSADSVKNVFAVGDVLGKADLTPVAINFGRRLSDWLFGQKGQNPLVWCDKGQVNGVVIPSVVFSHPPIGSCGLSEKEAIEAYGKDNIRVWNAKFVPLYCSLLPEEDKFKAVTKLITTREFSKITNQEEDICIGIHLLFPGADEAMQGFAMAVVNRLPKTFLDNTIAIHPSASEELVLFR